MCEHFSIAAAYDDLTAGRYSGSTHFLHFLCVILVYNIGNYSNHNF